MALDEATKSSHKMKGKYPTPPFSSPVILNSSPEGSPEPAYPNPSPAPIKMNKNMEKFLAIGKELYFGSNAILWGRIIHQEVREFPLVK